MLTHMHQVHRLIMQQWPQCCIMMLYDDYTQTLFKYSQTSQIVIVFKLHVYRSINVH